jgi:hypothetical protein
MDNNGKLYVVQTYSKFIYVESYDIGNVSTTRRMVDAQRFKESEAWKVAGWMNQQPGTRNRWKPLVAEVKS